MSAECNDKKKAAGNKGFFADLLGLSLVGGKKEETKEEPKKKTT